MTNEQYNTLVTRLEREAHERPGTYKLRILLLALLGYAYIVLVGGVLLLLIGSLAWIVISLPRGGLIQVALKLGVPLVGLTVVILRSLWVRLHPPNGIPLSPKQAGPLFQAVQHIRRALKSPTVHSILLNEEFNASLTQIPRLGFFGWQRNYLTIGLPLLHTLSPVQFRAVLAHELGHLCGAHSRFAGWIYRIRKSWYQLMERLREKQHWGSFIFHRFFQWYAPYFGAYSFVLVRANEYEADRCAARLVGPRHTADALINLEIHGAFLSEKFWPAVHGKADHEPDPPSAPYTEMRWALRADPQPEDGQKWLDRAMAIRTTNENTHPCLADRLAALGEKARVPQSSPDTAAQHFLGGAVGALSETLNRDWKARISPSWRQRHAYAAEAQQRLRELEQKANTETLPLDGAWQRAYWTEEFHGTDAALPFYRHLIVTHPDHAAAQFALGRILLSHNNAEGIAPIETAMALDPDAVLPGCELVYTFLKTQGREQDAAPYFDRAVRQHELLELARQERAGLSVKDTYRPHGLSSAQLGPIRKHLLRYPQITQAYLVRKEVKYFPEKPLYALGIVVRRPWYRYHSSSADQGLPQQLASGVQFPGETFVLVLNSNPKFKKIMKRIPGADIYQR